jgi:hypothetical protein
MRAGAARADLPSTAPIYRGLPSLILLAGGIQLTLVGLFSIGAVDELAAAMIHPSTGAASAERRRRLTVAWSFLASGFLVAGSSIALRERFRRRRAVAPTCGGAMISYERRW